VAKDCPRFFGKPTWQPLLNKINDPLVALQSKLKDAIDIIQHKVGAQCRNASAELEGICKHVSTTVDAAVARTHEVGQDVSKTSVAKLSNLRAKLIAELTVVRSTFGNNLAKVGASLDVLVGACHNVEDIVKPQCQAAKLAGTQLSTSTKQVEGSLQHISDAGEQVDTNCEKLWANFRTLAWQLRIHSR